MSEVNSSTKLTVAAPQRKGAKSKVFYGPCARDGKFSPRCINGKFMRPRAVRSVAHKTVADKKLEKLQDSWIETEGVQRVVPFKKQIELKADICQFHRENQQIKLPGFLGRDPLGPTTAMQLRAECKEPILWKTQPTLRIHLRTPGVVAIGSTFHDAAVPYFNYGRLAVLGRFGLHGYIALMLAFPDDAGLTYPLRVSSETSYGSVRARVELIRARAEKLLRQAIRDHVLRSKFEIFEDRSVVWAAAEHRIAIPLSTLLGDLFGVTEKLAIDSDPIILGELDRTVTRWLPEDGVLEVLIDDFKTLPEAPDEGTRQYYRQSIQMPIYGALMEWAHLSSWEEMPTIKIRTRYQLIWEEGTETIEVPYSREIALEALCQYQQYRPYLAQAFEFGKGKSFREIGQKYFPAVANEKVCPNCFAYQVCSLTRPLTGPPSYLDESMPTKEERPKGQNLPLWDQP